MKNNIENSQTLTYMQACESYSILVNLNGEKLLKSKPMKFFEASFTAKGWFKVHRSFMVNPEFVKNISENRDFIFLKNGIKLPIARRKLKTVAQWRMKNI